jgi:hypothetical protein
MISIQISRGTRGPGVPAGTKNDRKCSPCFATARIVTPIKIITENPIATITLEVSANEYGTFPNRLPNRIKKNSEYRNGRYCSFELPTCSLVCACSDVYADSNPIPHRLGTRRIPCGALELIASTCSPTNRTSTRTTYSPRLVSDRFNPMIGAFSPTRFDTSNCSSGDASVNSVFMFITVLK